MKWICNVKPIKRGKEEERKCERMNAVVVVVVDGGELLILSLQGSTIFLQTSTPIVPPRNSRTMIILLSPSVSSY